MILSFENIFLIDMGYKNVIKAINNYISLIAIFHIIDLPVVLFQKF